MIITDFKVPFRLNNYQVALKQIVFSFIFMVLLFLLFNSEILFNCVYASEKNSCNASNKIREKFNKESQQISDLLAKVNDQKSVVPDLSEVLCTKKITDYPETKLVFSLVIKTLNSYYVFSRGNGFRLDEKKWIELQDSLIKYGTEKKVKTSSCNVPDILQGQIIEKSKQLLKGLNKLYPPSPTSIDPLDYYETYCIEYSTPEFDKFQIYGFGSGNQGDFEFSFNKNVELISIYNEI